MESPLGTTAHLVDASKRVAEQALIICENRIQLALLEAREERDRIFRAFWLSLGAAVFGLLAGVALTALITVACWTWSPVTALSLLVLLYGGIAGCLYAQLNRLRSDWDSFSATFNELQKDHECLKRKLN